MSIGVAIVGGGIFAREQHKPAVEAAQELTLKAVYSRSLKSAQSLEADSKVDLYSDDSGEGKSYADLLKRDDIHAVIIALPITKQPQFIKDALSAGKHVLSEKPIAGTVAEAQELIKWYKTNIDSSKTTWGIAENFRFLASIARGQEIANDLGRVLNFRLKMNTYLAGGKYFETEWRKTPTHQGGFVLDGGVHNIAALRQLLKDDPVSRVAAFTTQNLKHLPPLDTIDAAVQTKSGATGNISISFGTTLKGTSYDVGYEKGSVVVSFDKVTSKSLNGDEKTEEVKDEGSGVKPEIRAWGKSLAKGKADPRQSPEEALADLEVLEAIFRSGEQKGAPQQLQYQV